MKTSLNGIGRIKKYEACVLHTYADAAGLPTIGYGHLIRPEEKRSLDPSVHITLSEAESLLAKDLAPAEEAVNRLVTVDLTQDQFDSLVSFTFNCGVGALASSSLLRDINSHQPPITIVADFLKWDKIHDPHTGKLVESAGLRTRRLDESKAW